MIPTRKVSGGMLAGAISILFLWAAKTYGGIEMPGETGSAITTILTFVTSYFVTDT